MNNNLKTDPIDMLLSSARVLDAEDKTPVTKPASTSNTICGAGRGVVTAFAGGMPIHGHGRGGRGGCGVTVVDGNASVVPDGTMVGRGVVSQTMHGRARMPPNAAGRARMPPNAAGRARMPPNAAGRARMLPGQAGRGFGVSVGPSGIMYPVDGNGNVVGVVSESTQSTSGIKAETSTGGIPVSKSVGAITKQIEVVSANGCMASTFATSKKNALVTVVDPSGPNAKVHESGNVGMAPGASLCSAPFRKLSTNDSAAVEKELENVTSELQDQINCQSCQDTCTPPFMSCSKGHLFCNICIKSLQRCPKCNEIGFESHQSGLEKVAMAKTWPCVLKRNGCKEMMKLDKLKEHSEQCRYKMERYCPIDGCKMEFMLNKSSFLKHLLDIHKLKPKKIHAGDLKNVNLETTYEATDYAKNKIDPKKKRHSMEIYEIMGICFVLIIEETEKKMFFINYVIGESDEEEQNLFCSRRFVDNEKKYRYAVTEPLVSMLERVGTKRKAEVMDTTEEPVFSIEKCKFYANCMNLGDAPSSTTKSIKSIVKIGKY